MRHRESVLVPLGYDVTYQKRLKYRGSGEAEVCIATKDGRNHFAIVADERLFAPGHFARLKAVQDSIPHMARVAELARDVVVFEEATGSLLWEMESKIPIDDVERQLLEFANATGANGLINGDLRPWNVFIDDADALKVIDWGLSAFAVDLTPDHHLVKGHYSKMHPTLGSSERARIDLVDAQRIIRMLKGDIGYVEAWGHGPPSWRPIWCKL